MKFKLRILLIVIAALATMAPVCVLSGGKTSTTSSTVELGPGSLVEVIGENAEVRLTRANSSNLELDVTFHNEEFIDFYTQMLTPAPVGHFVISATTSTGGETTANSVIEIRIPDGVQVGVRTTNRAIVVEDASVTTASLATTNAEIAVTDSSGDFDISTTNSEVTVQAVDGYVNIATTNAHVWFDGIIDRGSNSISTLNGDIAVRLRNGSSVLVSGTTHNGEVSVNGGDDGVTKDGDTATIEYAVGIGSATLSITNGPGAIHINPDTIAVFDGDS